MTFVSINGCCGWNTIKYSLFTAIGYAFSNGATQLLNLQHEKELWWLKTPLVEDILKLLTNEICCIYYYLTLKQAI